MRAVIWLTAAFAIFYGGYWAVGSRAVLKGTEAALAELRAAGRAEYGEVTLEGFPSRFELTIEDPQLTNTDGAVHWSAPELQIYALSYKPHHIIAVLPSDQAIRIGREEIVVKSGDLRASAVFGIDPLLPLKRAQSVGKTIVLTSDQGWGSTLSETRLALWEGESAEEFDLGAEMFDIGFSGPPASTLSRSGLPIDGGHVRLDATLRLDRPIDRNLAAENLRLEDVTIKSFVVDWGSIQVSGTGQVEITPKGQPEGRIELSISDWRRALRLATEIGLIRSELAPTVENALLQIAHASGSSESLELPVIFTNGWMSLGPVPLGPAPQF